MAGASVPIIRQYGMNASQGRQFNTQQSYIQNTQSPQALRNQASQQLALGKAAGLENDPYYDRFRTLRRTGSISASLPDVNAYNARMTPQALSGGGGGVGGGGVGGGVGSFIGGTTGVLPGFAQYQEELNAQGQAAPNRPALKPTRGRKPPERFSTVQQAYKQVIGEAEGATRATAAMTDDKGNVYGMGPVPGFGMGTPAAGLDRSSLGKYANTALRGSAFNQQGQSASYAQPRLINSPFSQTLSNPSPMWNTMLQNPMLQNPMLRVHAGVQGAPLRMSYGLS
jgi:hypothetical protein